MDYKFISKLNHYKMISRHIDEFVVLIIAASFHKQSEGELMNVFFSMKNDRLCKKYKIIIFADSLISIMKIL